ncbi:hypothetical protein AC477_01835 [miscellaneous Crenarchaeota group-1 archaeon SG8-32-1]|uniref:Uncharacterized protein n=1 Tax=miscellaneous Crenarchaeota group-1 archaeon SG8-32-1 TaxID=1685124 RepID=A0A0M0BX26_9ARCH|nr:MAG: hypothetical protein AC477_01835 [miscellaneous Crenarchaeota group-1 archaeon SG8-32-1]
MKFTKLFLISFTLLLSSIMIVQLGIAQVRTVGVSEGEWFKYGIELDWNYELEESPEDFIFTDFLEGDIITLTIQDVSGTNVTGQFTIHYENGSERILNGSVDLTTGEGDLRNWLISANLNANNPLYETEIDETINQTVSQSYPWGSRQTNQLLYSYNFSSGEDYSSLNLGFYWDQEIGILTELSLEAEMQQNGTLMDGSVSLILTESNQQNIPEFPTIILVLLFILVTLLAIIYEKYTSRNKLAH